VTTFQPKVLLRKAVYFSDVVMLGQSPYLEPTGTGANPRNVQASYRACEAQCEALPACGFGTFMVDGERAKVRAVCATD
jgi:hypothetical protein